MAKTNVVQNLNENPLIELAGHVLFGSGVSIGAYLGGEFVQGIATAINYSALAGVHLPVVTAGLAFAGYVGYVILNWSK